MTKIYSALNLACDGTLNYIPEDFPYASTIYLLEDLATIKKIAVTEYSENGGYISNIINLEKIYRAEVLKRLQEES